MQFQQVFVQINIVTKNSLKKVAFDRHVAIIHDTVYSSFDNEMTILLERWPDGTSKEQIICVKVSTNTMKLKVRKKVN